MDTMECTPSYLLPGALSLCLQDVDELNHAVSGADLELLQLRPGSFHGTLGHLSFDSFSIDQGDLHAPVRARGALDKERFGISFFHQRAQGAWNGHAVDDSRILYFMPGGELDGHSGNVTRYGWTSLIFSPDWIESIARTVRHTREFLLASECRTFQPDRHHFNDLWQAVVESVDYGSGKGLGAAESDWQASGLQNALGAMLTTGDNRRGRERAREISRYKTARQADSYMRERICSPLCIDELCIAMRVSRRYLEYIFADVFGTSPSRYHRLLRLHEVRRRLKNPDVTTTVTSESFALGFNHPSLFSCHYKKAFGESPGITLVGARCHAGLPGAC